MVDGAADRIGLLLGLGVDDLSAGQMALRAGLTFIVTLAVVRVGDKRLFGKGTAFDIITAIMIGSVMSRAITGSSPLVPTWVAGLVLVGMHWLVGALSYHLDWFGPLVKGQPVLLVEDGQILREGMREGSVSRNDLEQAIRMQGSAADPARVERAYLERDGSISIIPKQEAPRILDVAVADGVQTVRIALE